MIEEQIHRFVSYNLQSSPNLAKRHIREGGLIDESKMGGPTPLAEDRIKTH